MAKFVGIIGTWSIGPLEAGGVKYKYPLEIGDEYSQPRDEWCLASAG